MNLYLLKRTDKVSWDEYDSAVVKAASEEEARLIHPSMYGNYKWKNNAWFFNDLKQESYAHGWTDPSKISVTLIGKALKDLKETVICASFNAG